MEEKSLESLALVEGTSDRGTTEIASRWKGQARSKPDTVASHALIV